MIMTCFNGARGIVYVHTCVQRQLDKCNHATLMPGAFTYIHVLMLLL